MRKHITMALVAIAAIAFNACSNEDIQVDQALTIRVNPQSVVSSFNYEVHAGELSTFDTNYELRTRLLIYNTDGKLSYQETKYLKNYTEVMTSSPALPDGTYTAVTITDVVDKNHTGQYWQLSSESELGQMRITYDATLQGFKRGILGIDSKKITISAASRTFELNPKAAGSLLCVHFKGIKQFDFQQLQINSNQMPDYCSFDVNGGWTPTFSKFMNGDSNVLKGIYYFKNAEVSTPEMVAYLFTLPGTSSFRFVYALNGETSAHYAGARMDQNLVQGKEYEVLIDFSTVASPADAVPVFVEK